MRCLQPRAATHRVLLATPAAVAPAVCARHNRPSPLMQPSVLLPLAMGNTMQQQHQRQRHQQQQWAPLPPVQAASDSSSGSSSGSDPQKPRSGLLNWFDRLPQQTQLMVMGGFLFIGVVGTAAGGGLVLPGWQFSPSTQFVSHACAGEHMHRCGPKLYTYTASGLLYPITQLAESMQLALTCVCYPQAIGLQEQLCPCACCAGAGCDPILPTHVLVW